MTALNNLHDVLEEGRRFIDRENDLDHLKRILHPDHRAWFVLIAGIGGVGKTSLAFAVARYFADSELYDAVVWTSAKAKEWGSGGRGQTKKTYEAERGLVLENLDQLAARVCKVFQCSGERSSPDAVSMLAKAKSLLADHMVLLVVDALEEMEPDAATELVQFVRDILPRPSKALITSRAEMKGQSEYVVELGFLTHTAAKRLVAQEADILGIGPIPDDVVDHLVSIAGGHPLTLQMAASLMQRKDPQDVLRELEGVGTRRIAKLLDYCFKSAYDLLSRDAQDLFKSLLSLESPIDLLQASDVSGFGPGETRYLMTELDLMSLVEPASEEGRYALHTLAREFGKLQLRRDMA